MQQVPVGGWSYRDQPRHSSAGIEFPTPHTPKNLAVARICICPGRSEIFPFFFFFFEEYNFEFLERLTLV